MRDDKSGWSIGVGDIIMVEDYSNIKRNLLAQYGLLTQSNIDDRFTVYKTKGGRQIQNSAQFSDCLINSIFLRRPRSSFPSSTRERVRALHVGRSFSGC